jgi:2'-5' RNA ligase
MRLFIALELPPDVLSALEAMQQQLQRTTRHPVKWVSPRHMHLTLQFLGEVEEARTAPILDVLAQAVQAHPAAAPTTLHLAPVGAFPNLKRPQTIWAGVDGNLAAVNQLQQSIAHTLEGQGFTPDNKPFHAHLTLGRVRREATPQQRAALCAALGKLPAPQAVAWSAGTPVLFQSTLTPHGPIYRKVGYE